MVDTDYMVHQFRTHGDRTFQLFMAVEIKTMNAELSDAQRDTLLIADQLLRNRKKTPTNNPRRQASGQMHMVYSHMLKKTVWLRAFGCHVLTFSRLGPDDSDLIRWDRRPITVEQLTGLLSFSLDPDTLKPLDLRLHHRKTERTDPLFQVNQ